MKHFTFKITSIYLWKPSIALGGIILSLSVSDDLPPGSGHSSFKLQP
jgi:hypothetical protein